MGAIELVGRAVGAVLAPLTAAGSFVRRARLFHPDGVVYRAAVTPLALEGAEGALAAKLAGPAIVRLSSGWWRGGKEWADILGAAIRFAGSGASDPATGTQDLLMATFRHVWTLPLGLIATDVHSFLRNDYHAVTPYEIEGLGRVRLHLLAPGISAAPGLSRAESLELAASAGLAVFELVAQPTSRLAKPILLARIQLVEPAPIDQEALRFSPFHAGLGIRPRGLWNAMRRATYVSSQRARQANAKGRR